MAYVEIYYNSNKKLIYNLLGVLWRLNLLTNTSEQLVHSKCSKSAGWHDYYFCQFPYMVAKVIFLKHITKPLWKSFWGGSPQHVREAPSAPSHLSASPHHSPNPHQPSRTANTSSSLRFLLEAPWGMNDCLAGVLKYPQGPAVQGICWINRKSH